MPQIQVFQCPSCGANLSYDGGPETSFACQFCGTSVVVPAELRPQGAAQAAPPAASGGMMNMGGGLSLNQMADLKRLAQSGQTIEAIRLYREITGVGLREAKAAVDQLAAGQPVVLTGTSMDMSGLTSDQVAQMAGQVMEAMREGRRDEAVELAQEIAAGRGRPMPQAPVPPVVPLAQPKRRGGVLSCAMTGCLVVCIAGFVGLVVAMNAGAPLSLSSLYSQALKTALATSVVQLTQRPQATRMPPTPAVPPATAYVPNTDTTAGAKVRATEQAQSRAADATATRAALRAATATAVAGATAEAGGTAAAQTQAKATVKAMTAVQAAWPTVISDTFANNLLGWPTGPSEDDNFAITTTVRAKKFAWVIVPKQGAYANAFPLNPKAYGDFNATVKVKYVRGGADGNVSAGLVFRDVDQDYGFFGVDPQGNYRIILAFPGSGIQDTQADQSAAINTGAGQVNQLTVRAIGSDFTFEINGQLVWQLSEDLPKGDFGVGVDAKDQGDLVNVEFTEFAVHAPKK